MRSLVMSSTVSTNTPAKRIRYRITLSENNDYIQLPPLKKDTPSDVVAFMWEYIKVPEDSREMQPVPSHGNSMQSL